MQQQAFSIYVKQFAPAILWFLFTSVLLFTPGKVLPEPGDWFGKINADKLIHVGIFALLSFLIMYGFKKYMDPTKWPGSVYWKTVLGVVVWGVVTELIQGFAIPNRSMSVVDAIADVLGAFSGLFIFKRFFLPKTNTTAP